MKITRRDFLRLGSLAAGTLTVASCTQIGRKLVQEELPASLRLPTPVAPSDGEPAPETVARPGNTIWRLLNRAGYGPRPGELERATQMGLEAYLEEQLYPEEIEDAGTDLLLRGNDLYWRDVTDLVSKDHGDAAHALGEAVFWRALTSKRQLFEAVVEFWSDHFNIYLRKNPFMPFFKIIDDREVIRPNALGSFRRLLTASMHSPAMLIYLDNVQNRKGHPNENYARELMELHTLGVDAGYSQQDVQEVARALTGWMVRHRGRRQGELFFNEEEHDPDAKQILGVTFPAGQGERDMAQLAETLLAHPALPPFIATKLVRRFVADEPPPSLVQSAAQTFTGSDGDIRAVLRTIFLSQEFAQAPAKLKRPYSYLISALRALHADVGNVVTLGRVLALLGQPLFQWAAPNGYPDVSPVWASNLLPRWNFALALVHQGVPGVKVPYEALLDAGSAANIDQALALFAGLTLGRPLDDQALSLFTDYIGSNDLHNEGAQRRARDCLALMLASPAFQWS